MARGKIGGILFAIPSVTRLEQVWARIVDFVVANGADQHFRIGQVRGDSELVVTLKKGQGHIQVTAGGTIAIKARTGCFETRYFLIH